MLSIMPYAVLLWLVNQVISENAFFHSYLMEQARVNSSSFVNRKEPIVFNVGFNDGSDAAYFIRQGYKVLAIDANPLLIKNGEARFREQIDSGQLVLLNYALSLNPSTSVFWINAKQPQQSSFIQKKCLQFASSEDDCKPLQVESRSCAALWAWGIPEFLQIDIEEYHYVCLFALYTLPRSHLPKYVSWEMHEFQAQKYPIFDVHHVIKLHAAGYKSVKVVLQSDPLQSAGMPESLHHGLSKSPEWLTVEALLTNGVINPRAHASWCDFHMKLEQIALSPPEHKS